MSLVHWREFGLAAALVAVCSAGFVSCGSGEGEPEATLPPGAGGVDGEETEVEGARLYTFTDEGFDSLIYVQILAVPGSQGHDHVMRATGYEGSILWDANDASTCEVDVTLIVDEIAADEDAMRDLVGYDGHLSDSDQESVKKNMVSANQLDSANFPTMTFSATACVQSGDDVEMTGDLTIHGVTQSVSTTFTPTITTEGLYASGTMTFYHTDFGIEPYKLLVFENSNEISLTLTIHGVPGE